jgi:cytochrome d ubiquinol oxidase subunit II
MDHQIIWFALWGILWAAYFMTDGFDLGVGIVYPLLGRSDTDRRLLLNTIGPVWDGNKVWLVAAGGATFAAFPTAYALLFSYLYIPFFLILAGLIFRGVALEFRGKGEGALWRTAWDVAFFIGSLLAAFLFGVVFGNLFQGLPMDAHGYTGSLTGLFHPYGLVTGCLFTVLFMTHGVVWVALKTSGDLAARAQILALACWVALLVVTVLFLVFTTFVTPLWINYLEAPPWLAVPLLAVAALAVIGVLIRRAAWGWAFFASSILVVAVVFTGVIGLFPNLIPSSLDPRYSLTLYNASSSPYTLRIMTFVAAVFVPLIIAYQIWVYRVFKGTVNTGDVARGKDAY